MHIKPYRQRDLEIMIRRTITNRIFIGMVDEDIKKRVNSRDPDIEKRIHDEVVFLNELQISCITGTLLLEFDAHHGNNFAVYMAMAVHLRSLECIKT